MALIIKPNTEQITIKGTDINLNELYVRLAWFAHPNGKTTDIYFLAFTSYAKYLAGEQAPQTSVEIFPQVSTDIVLANGEKQDSDTVHRYAIEALNKVNGTKFTYEEVDA